MIAPLIGGILKTVLPRVLVDKDKRLAVQSAIEQAVNQQEHDIEASLIEAKQAIITAEAQGESWLQRNWRPLVMLDFAAILTFVWVGGALNDDLARRAVEIQQSIPGDVTLYDVLLWGVGGYVMARSGEKVAKQAFPQGWKGNQKKG